MSLRLFFSAIIAFCVISLSAQAADIPRVGTYDFPTSTQNAEAQEQFMLGVGYLHSFGFTQAQAAFRRAQELDPDFAMAYWGEVFTYQHPFFGPVSDGPAAALERLAPTSELRLAKAPNDKEKGFLKAAEAYALTPGGMPERRIAWNKAMEEVYEKYPNDDEVIAFYTVSTLAAAGASGDMRERMNMKAGALALDLFKRNDNHPGAAHYVIHAFDDPIHAPIALEAALKYRDIAPAVSHARHMPSHIFIQHGMWDMVAEWNDSAYLVARELWKPGDAVGEQNHASDWGQYGDLQRGDLERSKLWIARAEETLSENPGDTRSTNTVKIMKARHTIETRDWQLTELNNDLTGDELLALGMSAANLGELDLADRVAERLGQLASDSPNNANLQIMFAQVSALAKVKRNGMAAAEEAATLLEDAIARKEAGRLPNGAATPLKPIHEFAGEIHLELGNSAEAVELFETSLLRLPNRPLSLLGAARAYAALGDEEQADLKYEQLLMIWSDDSMPSVQEAKRFVALN
ncbi:MAG: hypothetical protein MI746_12335 [Pseudomonadales bacterium]|nr:hypothetical protein [Pseudomonadales bacterium]